MPLCSAPDPSAGHPLPRLVRPGKILLFFEEKGSRAVYSAATVYLEARGFSVGRMQARSPTGILFGDFDIQKWRNLSPADVDALHGTISGDFHAGPVTVTLFATAPAEARAAFEAVLADA